MTCWTMVLLSAAAPSAYASGDAVRITVLENTADRVVLQYELGEYAARAVEINGRQYNLLTLGKEAEMLEAGAPALPHVCRSIVIPDDAEMAVHVTASDYADIKGVDLAPSKGNLSRTINPDDVPYTFGAQYKTNEFYPSEIATLGAPYILRDCRGVVVELRPLQYNPVTRTLRTHSKVTLEIVRIGLGQLNALDRTTRSGEKSLAFHNLYQHHFLNYNPGPRYTPLDENGNMLIICYDSWLTNVASLVTHKNSLGISTTAVGVSTIGNNSTSIKSYIQNLYNTTNLAFVLLVGDSTQVATPTVSYGGDTGASDPSYSKLAGSDNYPDIMVGRFSASSSAHVDTQVLRTIEYETMPATSQTWFWKGTGIGSQYGTGDDGEYDWEHIDNFRDMLLAHGYTTVDQIYGASATASQVSTALNAGRGIINYCGHGDITYWGTTGFSNTNVAALTNDNMLPFIFSVACLNGRFNGYTCFGEAWLRSTRNGEPIGAIGAYMSSINQDWNPPMQAQDAFNALYVASTPSYYCFGTLCYAGSCSMMDSYGSGSSSSGTGMFNTWHVFGDPSVRVIAASGDTTPPTPNPMTFASAPAPASSTSIAMTANTATDATSPPVSYFFDFVSGGAGGTDSAWQAGTTYTDTGLTPNTSYTYAVKARDSAATPNETSYSSNFSAVTWANVPTAPSLSGATRGTIGVNVNVNGNPTSTEFAVQCTAASPSDSTWVGKYVNASGAPSASAVWRTDAQWATTTVTGLEGCTSYTFAVKARNSQSVETAFGAGASLSTTGRKGDLNGDNDVDGADIQAFVTCTIAGGDGCGCANMTASAFVNCLLDAGTCP